MIPTHYAEFALAAFVLIVIPGPSVLFVISRGVALGRRAALATVVGNAGGLAAQGLLIAVGLGAIVSRSETVFTVIKLIGAAYLVFLGVKAIRNRRQLAEVLDATEAPKGTRRILREGFVVGATNPKGFVLFTALMPQFVDQAQGQVGLQFALFGLTCVVIALVSDGCWALLSGSVRHWMKGSPRRLEWLGGAGGATMIGLGVALAATGRPDR